MAAPVTALYAALSGILLLVLAALVVRARWATRTALGTGTDPRMERAVRVHANFVEYVPLALLLLLLAELNGLPPIALHAAGLALVVSRVLHAWGLSRHSARSFGRFWGTLGTWITIAALALALLVATLA
ncbi:MAG: MAPEG family protein [Steroidobacteraceae bacterium]|jgi:hypothetical protein|nr:MAPEG family protein [Steroidobacteraceae bacterium]